MYKRFVFSLICFIALLTMNNICVNAATYNNLTYELNNNCITITGCKSTSTSIDIPSEINGFPVTAIASEAFCYSSKLSNVIIPESVVNIGIKAFQGCEKLKTVGAIGSGCNIQFAWKETIPDSAFYYCDSITELTIPYGVKKIGMVAFAECPNLVSIHLPSTVEDLYSSSFSNTGYQNNINNWEDNVLYLDNHLLSANTNIEGYYSVKDNTYSIAAGAFRLCEKLTGIGIPNNIKIIGNSTFYGCTRLSNISFGNNISYLGYSSFGNCIALSSVSLPDSMRKFEGSTFEGCNNIESIDFGEGVTIIPDNAFSNLNKIKSVTVPSSVVEIGDNAFSNCENLNKIILPCTLKNIGGKAFYNTAYYLTDDNWEEDVLYIDDYLICAKNTVQSTYLIKDGTRLIANGAFYYNKCNQLKCVFFPTTLKYIGRYAFGDCTSLNKLYYFGSDDEWNCVTINDSSIKSKIVKTNFFSYQLLNDEIEIKGINYADEETIIIPDTISEYPITKIADGAFWGNNSIKTVSLPKKLKRIGIGAFASCSNLSSVNICDCVESIGQNAFNATMIYNQSSNWEQGLLYVGNHLVSAQEDENIGKNIIIRDGTKTIADYLFLCKKIESIKIPKSLSYIGDYAFEYCYNLKKIIYDGTIDEWHKIKVGENNNLYDSYVEHKLSEKYAEYFTYKKDGLGVTITGFTYNLTDIDLEIPKIINGCEVIKIADNAFENLLFKSIVIPDTVKEIGKSAFYYCYRLKSIQIPDSVEIIGDNAFMSCTSLENVKLSNNITIINKNLFSGCSSLKRIDIPDKVTKICDNAFDYCSKLEAIVLNDTITDIGDYAFVGCGVKEVRLPETLNNMGMGIFLDCKKLEKATIPWGITSIGISAFGKCISLSEVNISDSVKKIGYCAFAESNNIKNVYYTASIQKWNVIVIDNHNDELKNAVIHYNSCEEHIYSSECDCICEECDYIRTTSIPHKYGEWEYENEDYHKKTCICSDIITDKHVWIEDIVIKEATHLSKGVQKYLCSICKGIKLVETPVISEHSFGEWIIYDEESHTRICECGVKEFENHTFGNWQKVDDNTHSRSCKCGYSESGTHEWDEGVISINNSHIKCGEKVFTCKICSCAKNEIIPKIEEHNFITWQSIDAYKHKGICECGAENYEEHRMWPVETVVEPAYGVLGKIKYQCDKCSYSEIRTTTEIASGYMYACYPDTITWKLETNGTLTFSGKGIMDGYSTWPQPWKNYSSSIIKVVIGEGITSIGQNAFADCVNLKNVEFPSTLKTICSGAFIRCYGLETIEIPSTITTIESNVFTNCTGLKNIIFPSTLKNIYSWSMNGCTSLEEVYLPISVEKIGYGIFDKCLNLKIVMYEGSKDDWNKISVGGTNEILINNLVFNCKEKNKAITNTSILNKNKEYEFKIKSTKILNDECVIVAVYDSCGKMIDVKSLQFNGCDEGNIIISKNPEICYAKILVWTQFLCPLSEPEIIKEEF